MKIAFIACWCHLRIYAIQASHLREHLEKQLKTKIKVITSNCGCYHPSLMEIFTSLFTYKKLLTDRRDISFIKLPHLRSKSGLTAGNCMRNVFRSFAEPFRGYLYSTYTKDHDIVHFHQSNDAFGYDALSWLLRLNRRAKKIVTIYGLSPKQKEHPELNELYNATDAVIVSTEYLKNILVEHGVEPAKIHVIPYGAILAPLDNNKARNGLIMFSGAPLIDVKGFQYLAPALRLVKERGNHINLKLHGFYMPGHKEWAHAIATKEGVEDMITWLNISSEDELH
jgi:glycosyltransferase involved in cell wall biosynthesis